MRASLLVLVILGGAGIAAAYHGLFYETGQQFYEACWERNARETPFTDAQASTPNQAILWAACTPLVAESMDNLRFWFGDSNSGTPESKALARDCPDLWTEVPLNKRHLDILAVEAIEKQGGPRSIDSVVPANWLIERALQARWPRCANTARLYRAKANAETAQH